jgi:hypothetical protein
MLCFTSCSDGCNDVVISSIPSPGGTKKAVIFVRDCGATTGFSTQISVLDSSASITHRSGNVFSADDNHGAVKLGKRGELTVRVRWADENHLVITFPASSQVFRRDSQVGNVYVTFVSV